MTTKRKATKGSKKAAGSGKAASSSKGAPKRSARAALAAAASSSRPVEERVAALAESPLAVCDNDESFQKTLKILRNKEEPSEVRFAALRSLAAAAFSVLAFESCRSDYIAALREVATDPDEHLRRRALGLLAREKDGFAQKKLLDGLKNPEKALVPPEKALQLLTYDIHSDAYTVAREVVKNPPNTAAKREAIRLLAADATSAPVLEKVLRDKDETPEIRQVSAAALQSVSPDKLQAYAREAVLDPSEHEEMQATSLTALTQFGDAEEIGKDTALMKKVGKMGGEGNAKTKQTARQFIAKYGGKDGD